MEVEPVETRQNGAFVERFAALLAGAMSEFFHDDVPRFEHLGGEHRGKGDGYSGGCADTDCYNPAQLLEQDARNAGKHRERHEYGAGNECGRDYRNPNLIGGVDRRLSWRRTALYVLVDIFQDHNCVIDHHTDCNRERRKRNDVERAVGTQKVDERHNERNRDTDGDDERRPPLSEEKQHHHHHKYQRIHHGFGEGVDGVLDGVGRVVDNLKLDVGREGLLDVLHHLLDVLTNLHRVAAGLFHDDETAALAGVDF